MDTHLFIVTEHEDGVTIAGGEADHVRRRGVRQRLAGLLIDVLGRPSWIR
jgi:hypothetical protein